MDGWSYVTLTVGNEGLDRLDDRFNRLGAAGWEMVAGVSTVKTWGNMTGNRLVFVFKHEGHGVRPPPGVAEGLDPDAPAY